MHLNQIYEAQKRLLPYLAATPMFLSPYISHLLNKSIWLKLETQLPTGSFKPRPAFNSILSKLNLAHQRGVIASSSGNFAQAVAYAARTLKISAMIVMMEQTSPYKIERTRALGAEVVLCDNTHEARIETTLRLQAETKRLLLEPYNSEETIAGDGTIALEIAEQLGAVLNEMTILVPVSGGGLIAGIAFAAKSLHPKCRIIGIQPAGNGALLKSFAAHHLVKIPKPASIADALLAACPGEIPFKLIEKYVDDVILVEDEAILQATRLMIEEHKLVIEPGGAVPIAALLANKIQAEDVICILSGGNIKLLE